MTDPLITEQACGGVKHDPDGQFRRVDLRGRALVDFLYIPPLSKFERIYAGFWVTVVCGCSGGAVCRDS